MLCSPSTTGLGATKSYTEHCNASVIWFAITRAHLPDSYHDGNILHFNGCQLFKRRAVNRWKVQRLPALQAKSPALQAKSPALQAKSCEPMESSSFAHGWGARGRPLLSPQGRTHRAQATNIPVQNRGQIHFHLNRLIFRDTEATKRFNKFTYSHG